ncbi:MAG: aminotransferase class I/II-fold pyridoxal phosphate-dependent enzyme [Ancalomicrobiaceae bacterium]|nr:aminotransferase class I/II-fold pyridoxal phosphate-dependent enzyme [Ancalomicrobiaceae bacterium]
MTSRSSASVPAFVSPFARLNDLLDRLPPGASAINMTVGEPRHAVPAIVAPVLAGAIADFGKYPPIKGTDAFRTAVAGWLDRRFHLGGSIDPATMVLPLNGSREGLFYAAIEARLTGGNTIADPVVLLPNPFYQAYAAGCIAAGCTPVMLPADSATGFLPDLEAVAPDILDRAVACYFASPSNPQGAVASLQVWQTLIRLARRHDFFLFADECYSEIYRLAPPTGVLEAAKSLGGFDHVLAFNSLSKRSNLPGLRCGFVAGDQAFIQHWTSFRNMAAPQVPLPLQAVAAAVLADEAHVEDNRRLYNAKFEAAERMLSPLFGNVTPPGGFFLWLDVARFGGGEAVTLRLWREAGVRVVPGGYLAASDATGHNPGEAYIRLALVDGIEATAEAFARLVEILA